MTLTSEVTCRYPPLFCLLQLDDHMGLVLFYPVRDKWSRAWTSWLASKSLSRKCSLRGCFTRGPGLTLSELEPFDGEAEIQVLYLVPKRN